MGIHVLPLTNTNGDKEYEIDSVGDLSAITVSIPEHLREPIAQVESWTLQVFVVSKVGSPVLPLYPQSQYTTPDGAAQKLARLGVYNPEDVAGGNNQELVHLNNPAADRIYSGTGKSNLAKAEQISLGAIAADSTLDASNELTLQVAIHLADAAGVTPV